MKNVLEWVGYDLSKVSQIYKDLNPTKKLDGVENSQEFLSKFVGIFMSIDEPSSYVTRETHYALSNAGFYFLEEQGFESINPQQYIRVRDKILEALVDLEISTLNQPPSQAWWSSRMGSLNFIFGKTQEEISERVRELVYGSS